MGPLAYIVGSVALVSALSVVAILPFALGWRGFDALISYLVSFAAGTLLGNVFLHLLPELAAEYGFDATTGLAILAGLTLAFLIERYVHWHHSHDPTGGSENVHPVSYMILLGDGVHNGIDGMIIAASYLVSVPLGVATTAAIAFHEIPQEIGDFGVLVYGGIPRRRAVAYNFLSALAAFLGAFVVVALAGDADGLVRVLLPLAAGNFVYIAASDLLPELVAEEDARRSLGQMATFVLGIGVLYALAL